MADPSTLVSSTHFHRRVTLQTPNHGSLTITYTDLGAPDGPTLFYLPGMFASRYLGLPLHAIAERAGVRLLVVDRPGMGGSTNVAPEKRVKAWAELFPILLAELGIQKVTLASHSAGTMYLMNSWDQCRDLITDKVFCLAPWVDPSHSKMTIMQVAQYIPVKLFDYWHSIPKFVVTQASPMIASSGAAMRTVTGPLSSVSGLGGASQEEADKNFLDANYKRVQRDYGISVEDSKELSKLSVTSMFEGQTVGANGEALVCLRKTEGKGADWGVCEDYAACAESLSRRERERTAKITLRAYFAETDALVGDKGQKYFEECWGGREGVEFLGKKMIGTDHDTVSMAVEVWEEIFSLVPGTA